MVLENMVTTTQVTFGANISVTLDKRSVVSSRYAGDTSEEAEGPQ